MLQKISNKDMGRRAAVVRFAGAEEDGEKFEPAGNEDFQARFLNNLMAKREEVEQALTRLIESQRAYGNLFSAEGLIEDFDHADREISAQTFCKLIERKDRELEKIDLLIRRVRQDEEFGLCEECGERIPEQRLFIVPEATLCVPCQREIERLESRTGSTRGSSHSARWKKGLEWEAQEEADDDSGLFITTDDDYISFSDMEELDLEESQAE